MDLPGTENNVAISGTPPARLGSALPDLVQGDDRSETPRDRPAPALAGRVIRPRRRSIRGAGGAAPSRAPAKAQTAGCG